MKQIRALKETITTPNQTLILMHERPDGDCLASSLALAELCLHYGHKVTIIAPTPCPRFISWLPGVGNVIIANRTKREKIATIFKEAKLIYCVDFGATYRVGMLSHHLERATATKVILDHHANPEAFADITLCHPELPATALLLYRLFSAMDMEEHITSKVALYLYVGILTDTGSFSHSNTTPETHRVVASLLEKGVNVTAVTYFTQANIPLERLRFFAHAIKDRLFAYPEEGFAYFVIPRSDFKKFKLEAGDTGGLVKYALNIEGVSVAVKVSERAAEEIHLSFRSFGDFSVSELTSNHFNGGGHRNAAGGVLYLPLNEAVQYLHKTLSAEKEKLCKSIKKLGRTLHSTVEKV